MELYEMIPKRKSVRSYTGVPVENAVLEQIDAFLKQAKPLYPDIRLHGQIVAREQIKSILPWLPPQLIAIYSEEKEGYLENAGFVFQQLELYLQRMGIGTCWIGMGKMSDVKETMRNGMRFVILLAFGYPKGPARRIEPGEFKRKLLSDISDQADERLEPARLAPSSVNSQPWYFVHEADQLLVYGARKGMLFSGRMLSDMNRIDIGIALAHLYVSNPETFSFSLGEDPQKEKGRSYIGRITL